MHTKLAKIPESTKFQHLKTYFSSIFLPYSLEQTKLHISNKTVYKLV